VRGEEEELFIYKNAAYPSPTLTLPTAADGIIRVASSTKNPEKLI